MKSILLIALSFIAGLACCGCSYSKQCRIEVEHKDVKVAFDFGRQEPETIILR